MATEVKKLYRSDDCVVAGVCAGIAEYCDIDPVIVRILAVLLCLSTLGLAILVYVVLWLVLPRRLNVVDTIACDTCVKDVPALIEASPATSTEGDFACTPSAEESQEAQQEAWDAAAWNYAQEAARQMAHTKRFGSATHYEVVARRSQARIRGEGQRLGRSVYLMVWAGVVVLFIGIAALISGLADEVAWWQMWPCLVTLGGLVIMVVPSSLTPLMRLACGIVLLISGPLLLLISVGLLSWYTLPHAFEELWPLLVIALGVFIISCALKNDLLVLMSALCVTAVIVAGLTIYAVGGPLSHITMHIPFLGVYAISVILPA